MNLGACRALLERASADGRDALFEHEAYALVEAAGIACPPHVFVPADRQVAASDIDCLTGDRVVVKAVAPGVLHKSEAGAVVFVPRTLERVRQACAAMHEGPAGAGLVGILLAAFIEHDHDAGGELLAGVRWTAEFGPVATLALGGLHSEFLATQLSDEVALVAASPMLGLPDDLGSRTAAARLVTEPMRGGPPRLDARGLAGFMSRLLALGRAIESLGVGECEMNPVVISGGELVALDALVTLHTPAPTTLPRPIRKLPALLRPSRIGIVGVSDRVNPGRIILRNLLREGTPPDHIVVVKPGWSEIDGCLAVPSVRDLPARVDLLVIAVAASQAPAIIDEVVAGDLAESIILIPGGFEEKIGGVALSTRIRDALDRSRGAPSDGPLLVGGNCLGIRSRPGRCDTMFIPEEKLPPPEGPGNRLAVISQSGAFAITRVSQWADLTPRYIITTGNQLDVTVGDLLTGLADDEDLDVFALYVEGFKPLDGERALEAVRSLTARGRSVIVYRAGRTRAGAGAARSHSASIGGDYRLTRALFAQAGAMVADTIDDFDDQVRLATRLAGRAAEGARIGAVSNAGFECVAMGDWLGALSLPDWHPRTQQAIARTFERLHVSGVVDVHNPLDLTPMTGDEGYEAIVRAVLADPGVDIGVVGCVPLTAALHTLACSPGADDLRSDDGVVARLGRLWREGGKPWVVIVDGGPLFDPMASALAARGIPVFRAADRALRALNAWALAPRGHRAGPAHSDVSTSRARFASLA